ncbi:hypothetical protein Tco_0197071, partial [Tanacetum coccineum]
KDTIGKEERELLNHDLENVECALGNVLERMSVLESKENATLKKKLAETEIKLVLARMERKITDDEDTERPRKKSKNSTSDGTEGPFEPRTSLRCQLVELIMPPKAMSEARMREVIREQVAASMAEFVANMNRRACGARAGGAGAGGAGIGGAGIGGDVADGAGAGGVGAGGAGASSAGAG